MLRTYRVVVAEPGLDGHDRGVEIIARALRDAGFEVIFTGLSPTPDEVAEAALQEDADAVGPAAPHGPVAEALARRGLEHVVVFEGGATVELPFRLEQALDERESA